MIRKERAARLIELLKESPSGLHKRVVIRSLALGSESTFYRVLNTARELYNVKIGCYGTRYRITDGVEDDDQTLTFLNDEELICLVTLQHIVTNMASPALGNELKPLCTRLRKIMKQTVKDPDGWADHFKVLDIHYRKMHKGVFVKIAEAITRKRAIRFIYKGIQSASSERTVSPLQLIRYKDNWYLDAWCHTSEGLRIFSIDAVSRIRYHNRKYYSPGKEHIRRVYATSFGIFSGEPDSIAVIQFTGIAARYAEREKWHPRQKLKRLKNGAVQLEIPYNMPHELIKEILSWGEEAKVLEPESLRNEVAERLQAAVGRYKNIV